jgi:acyl-coenzyme A synthetase/AMP-(fatty) acid ligase
MITRASEPEAASYYDRGFWRREDLWQDFDARATERPDKPALVCGQATLTFGELRDAASALSKQVADQGVRPGDVVGLCGHHSIEAVVALTAGLHGGWVLAPVPPMFSEEQLRTLMRQCGARALLGFGSETSIDKCRAAADAVSLVAGVGDVGALLATAVDAPRRSVDPDAMAVILLSSGTTSTPKGIVHSTNTIRYASEQVLARWGLGHDDRLLVITEFGFVGGLVFGYLPCILSGATAVLLPRWDAAEAARLIERHRCTYTLLMPTHGADLLYSEDAADRDLSSLRVLVSAGMSRERRIAMRERFGLPPLGDYGLSEVPGNCAPAPDAPWEKILETDGLPFDGTDVRILDADDLSVASGVQGHVVINGPSRFLCFFGNEQLTMSSLTDWGGYRTGDIGTLDDDGYFTYVGRDKDIIRRGGITIVPTEIEPVLLRHRTIREVALVGVDDERLGERACAAILLQPGASAPTLEELQATLAEAGIAKYAWPERVEVFDLFPRTPSLKPIKREIRAEIAARVASEASAQPTAEATAQATAEATAQPTAETTAQPTAEATAVDELAGDRR